MRMKFTKNASNGIVLSLFLLLMLSSSCKKENPVDEVRSNKQSTIGMNTSLPMTLDNIGVLHNTLCNTVMYELLDSPYYYTTYYWNEVDTMIHLDTVNGINTIISRIAANLAVYYEEIGLDRDEEAIVASLQHFRQDPLPTLPSSFLIFRKGIDDLYEVYKDEPLSLKAAIDQYYAANVGGLPNGDVVNMAKAYKNVLSSSREFWHDNAQDIADATGEAIAMRGPRVIDGIKIYTIMLRILHDPIAQADARGSALGVGSAMARGVTNPHLLAAIALECAALASLDAAIMQ
jgi:hypothetical protein